MMNAHWCLQRTQRLPRPDPRGASHYRCSRCLSHVVLQHLGRLPGSQRLRIRPQFCAPLQAVPHADHLCPIPYQPENVKGSGLGPSNPQLDPKSCISSQAPLYSVPAKTSIGRNATKPKTQASNPKAKHRPKRCDKSRVLGSVLDRKA